MMAQTAIATISTTSLNSLELGLLEGCLAGDRKAQKTLYLRYSNAMYTLAFRITGNGDSAHDVLQDAFIEVFRDLKNFKKQSTLGAWIKTIVVRKASKKSQHDQRFETFEEDVHDESVPYQEFNSSVLEKMILDLPDGYRTVFTLYEIEGYKHKEIGEMLQISEGTSRSQLLHAKKMLRKKLSGETK